MRCGVVLLLGLTAIRAWAQPDERDASMLPTHPLAENRPLLYQERPPLLSLSPQEAERLTGGPTLITLHVDKADPRRVMESIARQAGIKLAPWNIEIGKRNWPHINLQANREPFWSVMQKLSAQVNWKLEHSVDTGLWSVVVRGTEELPWLKGIARKVGPYRVLAASISTSKRATLNWNTSQSWEQQPEQQYISLELHPDPHLLPYYLTGTSSKFDVAIDEKGRPLLEKLPEPQNPLSGEMAWWNLSLGWTKKSDSRAIGRIGGSIKTLLAFKREKWEVPVTITPDGLSSATATRTFETSQGPVTYHIELIQTGRDYSVTLSMIDDKAWKSPSFGFGDMWKSGFVRVVDSGGSPLHPNGGGVGATYQMRMKRADPWGNKGVGVPAEIIVNMPTDLRSMVVPFEFQNLPLS